MPKRPERSLRTILLYLPERRAAELAIQLGGDPTQPFNPTLYPPLSVTDVLAHLTEEELWHLAMAWCHRRGDAALPRGEGSRRNLLEMLTEVCQSPHDKAI